MNEYKGKLPGYSKDWTETEKIAYIEADIRLFYLQRQWNKELQQRISEGKIPGFNFYELR